MSERKVTPSLFIGNTSPKDLIRTILEKAKIIPIKVFHLGKKPILILF